MPRERTRVKVVVPATTANMGPGFDCIGMALDIWNELTVERSDKFEMDIVGEGADTLPRDSTNLVVTGIEKAFEAAGKPVPPLKYTCVNRIPYARGMGSSSAAIVSGLVAGLVLAGHELEVEGAEEMLQLAASIEGHPDNVAPAIYGGLQLGIHTGERWYTSRVSIPYGLQTVLFIPKKGCKTSEARGILPKMIDRSDAVYNMGRTALLVHAFNTGQMSELKYAVQDRLHQPQRSAVMPFLYPVINAAMDAGAHGAFLSGAGSTVLAITSGRRGDTHAQKSAERKEKEVKDAMSKAAHEAGWEGSVVVTRPTEVGARVVEVEPADDE
eukprot:Colp12_sorted_trinity150504_noHs@24138